MSLFTGSVWNIGKAPCFQTLKFTYLCISHIYTNYHSYLLIKTNLLNSLVCDICRKKIFSLENFAFLCFQNVYLN